MSVALDTMLHHVLPYAPQCPEFTALHFMRQAAIDLCTKTLVWRATLADILSVIDQTEYAMTLPAGTALVKILSATLEDDPIAVVTPDKGNRLVIHGSDCGAVWTLDRTNLNVTPTPIADDEVYSLEVALKPTQAATTIDSGIAEHHARDIAAGALAELLDMPGKAWTNPGKAQAKRGEFEGRINVLAAQAAKGYGRGAQRVKAFTF